MITNDFGPIQFLFALGIILILVAIHSTNRPKF
jgi:hypothetical protein